MSDLRPGDIVSLIANDQDGFTFVWRGGNTTPEKIVEDMTPDAVSANIRIFHPDLTDPTGFVSWNASIAFDTLTEIRNGDDYRIFADEAVVWRATGPAGVGGMWLWVGVVGLGALWLMSRRKG